jgi:putative transposase
MNLLDEIFTACPFYGSRRMVVELERSYEIHVCRDHVRRLMREMGLEAIYPKKSRGSEPNQLHKKYPYLLTNLSITTPNQVWGTDITYIRLAKGFCYLVALIDWYSRYVVAWQVSDTLHMDFCLENLNRALTQATPIIHNSDQGSHFTSPAYTDILTKNGIQISMDGRGRCMDNIFTERLWRTAKYEDVYIKSYATIDEAREGINNYFPFYNKRRPHQSLNYRTPETVYRGG